VALQAAWLQWQQEKSEELALRIADVFGFPTQKPELDLLIKQAQQDKELKALASKLSFLPAMAIAAEAKFYCRAIFARRIIEITTMKKANSPLTMKTRCRWLSPQ